MAVDKIRVVFDATVLENSLGNKMLRTGVYFTAYNIVSEMSRREDIELLFFTHNKRLLKRYLRDHASEFGAIPVFDDPARIPGGVEAYFSAWYPICDWVREYFPAISCYCMLYDIIGIVHPEYLLGMKLPAMWRILNESAINDHYFAISQHTKNDIVRMGRNFHPDRISVVPLAANSHFYHNTSQAEYARVKAKYGIPEKKNYILSLCSIDPRKNVVTAVNAFIEFIEKNAILDLVFVLAGNPWPQFREEIERHVTGLREHAEKLIVTGYVDDEDVSVLYSNAQWFVYTSRYEGFGLPPLEAMQCGCPVITSNNSSLPEVVGDAGIMIDSMDVTQHVDAYKTYYYQPEIRETFSAMGVERAKRFSWKMCTEIICSRMLADAAKKMHQPTVSIVVPVNHHESRTDSKAIERTLASIRAQRYQQKEIVLLDCGGDPVISDQLQALHTTTDVMVKRFQDSDPFAACNSLLPSLSGDYAIFLEPGAYFPQESHLSIRMAKSIECDADLSYTDSLLPNGQIYRGDIERIALGDHFRQSAALVRVQALRRAGGFLTEYGSCAFDELVMRFVRENRTIVRIRHTPVATTEDKGKAGIDAYADAFFANFGTNSTLSRAEFRELYSGEYLKVSNDARLLSLAGKLPFAVGGWAICKDMVDDRHMGEILDEQLQATAKSRYLLFGCIPLSCAVMGDSLRNVITFAWRGIPFISVNNRSAQSVFRLFSLLPFFLRKKL